MLPAEDDGGRDFQGATRFGIFATHLSFGAVDVLQNLLAAFQIELAAFRQTQRSRGAQEQCQAELILELRDRSGDDRGRKLQTPRCFGEAAEPGNGNEDPHGAEMVHGLLLKQQ